MYPQFVVIITDYGTFHCNIMKDGRKIFQIIIVIKNWMSKAVTVLGGRANYNTLGQFTSTYLIPKSVYALHSYIYMYDYINRSNRGKIIIFGEVCYYYKIRIMKFVFAMVFRNLFYQLLVVFPRLWEILLHICMYKKNSLIESYHLHEINSILTV